MFRPQVGGYPNEAPCVNILVVEDQKLLREFIVSECASAVPGARLDDAGDCATALTRCTEAPSDLVLLDLVLPDGSGLDLLPRFYALSPRVKVIALSSHIDEFTVVRALGSRVQGILDKNQQPVKVLREAIATVIEGRQYVSPSVQQMRASIHADPFAFDKILSNREQHVLGLVGEGLSNEEISMRLEIGTATVKSHRLRIMAKLDLHSTPQLIRYAIDKGFTHARLASRRTAS